MMRTLKQLYDLQDLDIKISSLEKSRAEVRKKLADNSAIISAKNELTETDSKLQKVLSEHRSSERDATQLSEKLQEIDKKLYGGSITSPRELSAAQEEREFTFQKQREESDRLLDLMVHSEELQEVLTKSKENPGTFCPIEMPVSISSLETNWWNESDRWRRKPGDLDA